MAKGAFHAQLGNAVEDTQQCIFHALGDEPSMSPTKKPWFNQTKLPATNEAKATTTTTTTTTATRASTGELGGAEVFLV